MPEPLEKLFEDAIDNKPASIELVETQEALAATESSVTGEEAASAADGAPPATGTEDSPQKMVPESALVGVRKDLQTKVSQLEQQLNSMRAAQQAASAPQPDPITEEDFDDPQKLVAKIESRFQKKFDAYRYSSSEEQARAQYSDYEDVMRNYADVVNAAPGLAQEVDRAALPAVTAYQRTKAYLDTKALGDPTQVESRIQNEVEKRVAAAMEKVRADLGSRLPQGIAAAAGATGGGRAEGQPWAGPTPLDKVLPRR